MVPAMNLQYHKINTRQPVCQAWHKCWHGAMGQIHSWNWGTLLPQKQQQAHHQNGNFVGKALTGKTYTTEILVHDFADKAMSDIQEFQTGKSWAVQNFVPIHLLKQRWKGCNICLPSTQNICNCVQWQLHGK
jgi:hypothetical protein